MSFQVRQDALIDLVSGTRSGQIQLPDFQRGYVWDDERVRQLLVTVAVDHPMGVILLMETGNAAVHFQAKPIEGTAETATAEPESLVLDGQQRLTSLTQALSRTGTVQTRDDGERRYFLDIKQAIDHPDQLDDAIKSLPASGVLRTNFDRDILLDVSSREKQLEAGLLPLSLLFGDGGSGTQWIFTWASRGERELMQVTKFHTTVWEGMRNYQLPSIELGRKTTMEAITTVFEKVNQGGVKLTVFELLTAKFAGDVSYFEREGHAFRLRDDWKVIRKRLEAHQVLDRFANDDFLQAVSLAASSVSEKPTTARKDDVLKLSLDDYLVWAPKVADALIWAAKFLDGEHIHTSNDVPYLKQVVPLAVVRVRLGSDADAYGVHARIRTWFWSGILGELYGSAIETRFARDVDQVPPWARRILHAAVPKTVEDAYFNQSRLLTLRTRNSAAYKGIYALLMSRGARDWIYNQSFDKAHYLEMKVDIHHIFPKAWCAKKAIDWHLQESILNKTPLARRTNIKLSGNAPSVYRGTIRKDSRAPDEHIDSVITGHLIDTDALWADDFSGMIRRRSEAMCQLIEEAMGKTVNRDWGQENQANPEVTDESATTN